MLHRYISPRICASFLEASSSVNTISSVKVIIVSIRRRSLHDPDFGTIGIFRLRRRAQKCTLPHCLLDGQRRGTGEPGEVGKERSIHKKTKVRLIRGSLNNHYFVQSSLNGSFKSLYSRRRDYQNSPDHL